MYENDLLSNLDKSRFDFLDIRIDKNNIGTHEKDNRFLMAPTLMLELDWLADDYEGYTPIGVCLDESVKYDYEGSGSNLYYPMIMENNNGDRIWIHIPYEGWKELLEIAE